MMDFIENMDKVGSSYCLLSIFVHTTYFKLELIFVVIFVYCGLPHAID
jgi:hypothetical protein